MTARIERPLSPHLQTYRVTLTMAMSIIHRATGIAMYFGTLLVAWWLIAAATGQGYFDLVNWIMGSIIGRIILFGYTWALLHHMLGGLRHFVWDLGYGFDPAVSTKMAKITIVASICLTVLVWVIGIAIRLG